MPISISISNLNNNFRRTRPSDFVLFNLYPVLNMRLRLTNYVQFTYAHHTHKTRNSELSSVMNCIVALATSACGAIATRSLLHLSACVPVAAYPSRAPLRTNVLVV